MVNEKAVVVVEVADVVKVATVVVCGRARAWQLAQSAPFPAKIDPIAARFGCARQVSASGPTGGSAASPSLYT